MLSWYISANAVLNEGSAPKLMPLPLDDGTIRHRSIIPVSQAKIVAKGNLTLSEKRLDAQVVGQVLMAFYLDKPAQVKYQRREIFGKYYSEVFNENVINTAAIFDHTLLAKLVYTVSYLACPQAP